MIGKHHLTVFTFFHPGDAFMLPWFFRHYTDIGVDQIIVNCTMDGLEMLRASNPPSIVEIVPQFDDGKSNASKISELRNYRWSRIPFDRDSWVMIPDFDELLYHPNWGRILSSIHVAGFYCFGFVMHHDCSILWPDTQHPLANMCRDGIFDPWSSQLCGFKHASVSPQFSTGGKHSAHPRISGSECIYAGPDAPRVLHYQLLGTDEQVAERWAKRAARVHPDSLAAGNSTHYQRGPQEKLDQVKRFKQRVI